MDPVMHLLLPLLILLALRIETRPVILLAPLTILPDFDAFFGLHRAVFHSFIPVLVLPIGLILYSKFRRPEWMLSALIVQFYLASHVVLDLAGVAFLWPFTTDMLYIDPELKFNMQGGLNFVWHFKAGIMDYQEMAETDFIAESTFGFLALVVIAAAVYRREAKAAVARVWVIVKECLLKRIRRP
jgi:membrane-bound metal-dependent hydrolase YbcI (DUF457 family)